MVPGGGRWPGSSPLRRVSSICRAENAFIAGEGGREGGAETVFERGADVSRGSPTKVIGSAKCSG